MGVFLLAGRFPGQSDADALSRTLKAVVHAEQTGFDDAWIAEHHFMTYGTCPSAISFAGFALGRTNRITIGTAVSVLSTTHPVALAEESLLLGRLSGGRFQLGVGRGGPWVDLEVFGTGLARYEHGFPESLDLLLDCLTRDQVAADGDHFAFRAIDIVPRPTARPAVAVACTSRSTVDLAAARGLPMLLGMHVGDDEKAEMVGYYAKAASAAGHDPNGIPHISTVLAHVAEDRQEAQRELRTAMPGWLEPGLAGYRPIDGRPRTPRDAHAYTDMLCTMHPIGSPEQCVERLRESAGRTGIQHVIMMVEGGGGTQRTLTNISRLGTEVLPRIR